MSNKNHSTTNSATRGFTLVEVIVVLVILAILAAIMIPSMTGWIDKANEGAAISEARACLLAAQGIAVERYAAEQQYSLSADKAETKSLAGVPDATDITAVTLSNNAQITYMVVDASNGLTVTYSNGAYSVSAKGGSAAFPFLQDGAAITNTMTGLLAGLGNTISNGTLYHADSPQIRSVLDQIYSNFGDLKLDQSELTAWSIRRDGNYSKLYVTTSTPDSDGFVYAMTYTLQSGNYNVYKMKCSTNPDGTFVMTGESKQLTPVVADQTYEKALQVYQDAIKTN